MEGQDMQLLHKPQHPNFDSCSKQDCLTMVDVSSVRTIGLVNSKFDEKLHDALKEQRTNTELKVSNAVLRVKDELHQEVRQLSENMHVEIRKVLDERLSFIATKLERNTKTLDQLQADVAKIKSEQRNKNESDEKEVRSMRTRIRTMEDSVKLAMSNLDGLTSNVKKLFDEFNRRP
jgi:hypothetical protein